MHERPITNSADRRHEDYAGPSIASYAEVVSITYARDKGLVVRKLLIPEWTPRVEDQFIDMQRKPFYLQSCESKIGFLQVCHPEVETWHLLGWIVRKLT